MKKVLFLLSSTLFFSNLFGQVEKDSAIIEFIKTKKDFVLLTDTNFLPQTIIPYYESVANYMSKNKMNMNDYYVWTSYIKNQATSICIPICHYEGFKLLKDLKNKDEEANKNRKKNDPLIITDINGNVSGIDGDLEIDKKTKKVMRFSLWQ